MINKKTDERFTPIKYINSVKKVFDGQIDLDSFSSELGNTRIKATAFYDKEANGFIQSWNGKVFANPPYSVGNLLIATEKIISEYKVGNIIEAIYLIPNWSDRTWFQLLLENNYPICFTDHRIDFLVYSQDRKQFEYIGNPQNGSCFVYFGTYDRDFLIEFSQYGQIINGKGRVKTTSNFSGKNINVQTMKNGVLI